MATRQLYGPVTLMTGFGASITDGNDDSTADVDLTTGNDAIDVLIYCSVTLSVATAQAEVRIEASADETVPTSGPTAIFPLAQVLTGDTAKIDGPGFSLAAVLGGTLPAAFRVTIAAVGGVVNSPTASYRTVRVEDAS